MVLVVMPAPMLVAGAGWDFTAARTKADALVQAFNDAGFQSFRPIAAGAQIDPTTATIQEAQFQNWTQTFNYNFTSGTAAYNEAFQNFRTNMAQVYVVNTDPSKAWWGSGNAFSHLSSTQFAARFLMPTRPQAATATTQSTGRRLSAFPTSPPSLVDVDWRVASKVTAVRDQGSHCGECSAPDKQQGQTNVRCMPFLCSAKV